MLRRITEPEFFDELGMYYTDVLHRPSEGLVYHRVVDSMKAVDVWTLYGIGRAFRALQMPDSAIDYFFLPAIPGADCGSRMG